MTRPSHAKPTTKEEMAAIRKQATEFGHLIDWMPIRIDTADRLIFGSFASKTVMAFCWCGELRYHESDS